MSKEVLKPYNYVFDDSPVRMVNKDGEPFFVAKDLCGVLGLKNSRQVLAALNKEEKGVISMDTNGGTQSVSIVSESGMYKILFKSRKKSATKFLDWVTSEVLPSIRKHGAYLTDKKAEEVVKDPENTIYELAEALLKEKEEREQAEKQITEYEEAVKSLAVSVVHKEAALEKSNSKIEKLSLSDDYLKHHIRPCRALVNITTIGAMVGLSGHKLNKWLSEHDVIRCVNGEWVPTARYLNEGVCRVVAYPFTHRNGTPGISRRTMWTERGVELITTMYRLIENKDQLGRYNPATGELDIF